MTSSSSEGLRIRAKTRELVLLERDPAVGYVYWTCPGGHQQGGRGQLRLEARDGQGCWQVVDSFEIVDARGGRFVRFSEPGVLHRCVLQSGGETTVSEAIAAPRRESGGESPEFVRVRLTERGLEIDPAEHDHPVHGRFPASKWSAPSSRGTSR